MDSVSSNVSTCCATDLEFIIRAQFRVGRQTREQSAIDVACKGSVTGNEWEVTNNAVKRRKNNGVKTVRSSPSGIPAVIGRLSLRPVALRLRLLPDSPYFSWAKFDQNLIVDISAPFADIFNRRHPKRKRLCSVVYRSH